jgi:hypothetical protein
MVVYIPAGILVVNRLTGLGAPAIAACEWALTLEAVVMVVLLNRRLEQPATAWSSLLRGLGAAVVGGGTAYLVAVYLPGSAVLTVLLGMAAGGLLAIPLILPELRVLLRL